MAAPKQLAEEIYGYARSERHLRHFQEWASAVASVLPVRLLGTDADVAVASDDRDRLVREELFSRLRTNVLGGVVLYSPAMSSTQTFLHETLRPAAPAGVVCYTTHQLQGKGRGSNTWVSPEGCLTFSEEFLAAFLNAFEVMETEFRQHGFAPFTESYLSAWLHSGQVVQVASDADSQVKTPATIKGLTQTGCLLAEASNGEKLELYPDGNSFDFLSGLLKRKL
ncbi:hypothetical protein ATCC90586_009306 [Pythium insidiosum]|nr:hypothetical protein ATCC90586_009306 [Pythium insidiosum]